MELGVQIQVLPVQQTLYSLSHAPLQQSITKEISTHVFTLPVMGTDSTGAWLAW